MESCLGWMLRFWLLTLSKVSLFSSPVESGICTLILAVVVLDLGNVSNSFNSKRDNDFPFKDPVMFTRYELFGFKSSNMISKVK